MTELTALLTKALLSTTFGVSREQRYSADELRDALARASGSVAETRKVLSAQPEVDDISVESVANHLRDRLSKYIDVGSDSVGHSFPVLGHNIRVPLPQHVTTYEPGDLTGSQSPQPHLEDGTTYRPLRPTNVYGRQNRLRTLARGPMIPDTASLTGSGVGRRLPHRDRPGRRSPAGHVLFQGDASPPRVHHGRKCPAGVHRPLRHAFH